MSSKWQRISGGSGFVVAAVLAVWISRGFAQTVHNTTWKGKFAVTHTDAEWKKILTPERYNVLRQAGTERAFTGKLWNNHASGTYRCPACGLVLFSSSTKFESGTGWPSFWAAIDHARVVLRDDESDGMMRTEVLCSRCGGHLGHVFDDGPPPTGKRYCMNSAALDFVPAKPAKKR